VTPAPAAAAPVAPARAGAGPARNPGGTAGGGSGTGGGGTNTGGSGTGGGTTGGGGNSGGGGGTSAPAPKITKFVVSKQPSCPVHGTADAPFSSPGNDVTISWSVSGAGGAAIAVDDPDTYAAYGTYGASGSLTLPFGCNDGTTTTHTYTVWPAGAHNVSKTISASAHSDN
jgi:hypothetical protein